MMYSYTFSFITAVDWKYPTPGDDDIGMYVLIAGNSIYMCVCVCVVYIIIIYIYAHIHTHTHKHTHTYIIYLGIYEDEY